MCRRVYARNDGIDVPCRYCAIRNCCKSLFRTRLARSGSAQNMVTLPIEAIPVCLLISYYHKGTSLSAKIFEFYLRFGAYSTVGTGVTRFSFRAATAQY